MKSSGGVPSHASPLSKKWMPCHALSTSSSTSEPTCVASSSGYSTLVMSVGSARRASIRCMETRRKFPIIDIALLPIEVRVTDHALTKPIDQRAALFDRHQLLAQRLFDVVAHAAEQVARRVVDELQHFADGVAGDDLFDVVVAFGRQLHVHRVRIAEQVVQAAEELLVRADEENSEVIVLAFGFRMELEHVLDVA